MAVSLPIIGSAAGDRKIVGPLIGTLGTIYPSPELSMTAKGRLAHAWDSASRKTISSRHDGLISSNH